MAVPTYATDLALIDDAQAVGSYAATGGGASALADETDYFINDAQCISKAGFTATQKGIIHDDVAAPTITAGDAVFIWGRQANRNILDTVANSGGAVIMGTSNAIFQGFNVDGSNVAGSELLSWISYAVDPTQTPSYASGSPGAASTWDHFGMEWKILGSGSLKGNPNAVGSSRHGRELTNVDGQAADYADFTKAAAFDAGITRRWGILTPGAGSLSFHGAFVMGTTGTSVDFRDLGANIVVLDDPFVPAGFNEFEIRNASSNVEWTTVQITALGIVSPFVLTLNVGTFVGIGCTFTGGDTTTFSSTSSCLLSKWASCAEVNALGADLSGSEIATPNVAANTSGLIWNVNTDPDGLLDDMTFTKTSGTAHHAIEFGTAIADAANFTLRGCDFGTDFSATEEGTTGDETFHFLDTTGTITLNLVACTGNAGFRTAGVVVSIVVNPITEAFNVKNADGDNLLNAKVFCETAATIASGEMFEAAVTTLTSSAGTATCTTTAVHGLVTGDKVVIRNAVVEDYNKVATVTVTSTTIFTYPVTSGISSPATGTPIVSFVPVFGTTDASGDISGTRTWGAAQQLKGWARLNTDPDNAPYYKDANFAYTIDTINGNSTNLTLQSDD
jgi:hypothetical protein